METHLILVLILACLSLLFFLYAAITSLFEHEYRAVLVSIVTGFVLVVIFTAGFLLPREIVVYYNISILVITLFGLIYLFLPAFKKNDDHLNIPSQKYDERDTMFSRRELIKGSKRYEEYYKRKPEHLEPDEKFRLKPGLMSDRSVHFDPITFASAHASFFTVEQLREAVDGEVNQLIREVDRVYITNYIKTWARKLGAIGAGVTDLMPYHLYSTKGRGATDGQKVKNNHKYAIAFLVEMNKTMMVAAPAGPTLMESAEQYLHSGTIAVQIASFIRTLGYEARAHIDGNYQLICPLVARDAGLGEIGRMGLLITKSHGPRARISVVTTNLPLITDEYRYESTVVDFCRQCKKCATNCPVNAIPFQDQAIENNVKRWKINSESCFTYWCITGTDCGRCMAVCPYSHPDNLFHKMIRAGIKTGRNFRKFAIIMDDLFYGKKPPGLKIPGWIKEKNITNEVD